MGFFLCKVWCWWYNMDHLNDRYYKPSGCWHKLGCLSRMAFCSFTVCIHLTYLLFFFNSIWWSDPYLLYFLVSQLQHDKLNVYTYVLITFLFFFAFYFVYLLLEKPRFGHGLWICERKRSRGFKKWNVCNSYLYLISPCAISFARLFLIDICVVIYEMRFNTKSGEAYYPNLLWIFPGSRRIILVGISWSVCFLL